jgi:hypothetical protein
MIRARRLSKALTIQAKTANKTNGVGIVGRGLRLLILTI